VRDLVGNGVPLSGDGFVFSDEYCFAKAVKKARNRYVSLRPGIAETYSAEFLYLD
jgi:hypothetical protein